jgi:glycosyltransferase involved in cell wall biosynthesis
MLASCAIIIPAFNAAAYLGEAIESALAQTTAASGVVVVDDGSTDETPEIGARFGDAVISLRQTNQGVSAARNFGAKQVTSEWLLFLDADDRLTPDALSKLLRRGAQSAPGVVYGQTHYFKERHGARRLHGNGASEGPAPAGARASFWKSAITTPGAAIIRAGLFREVGGFNPAVDSLADRDFWMKAGALSEFGFVAEPVIEKREHDANMSGNLDRTLHQIALVQLGFFTWCREKGIDTGFLSASPADVIDNVLNRALAKQRLAAVKTILALADEHHLHTPLVDEARHYTAMPAAAAHFQLSVKAGFRQIARLIAP